MTYPLNTMGKFKLSVNDQYYAGVYYILKNSIKVKT